MNVVEIPRAGWNILLKVPMPIFLRLRLKMWITCSYRSFVYMQVFQTDFALERACCGGGANC